MPYLDSHPNIWPKVLTNEISCLLWLWPGLLPWEPGLIWIQLVEWNSEEENREAIVSLYKIKVVLCFNKNWNSENSKNIHKKKTFLIKLYFPTTLKRNRPSAPLTTHSFRVLTSGSLRHVAHIYFVTTGMSVQSKVWREGLAIFLEPEHWYSYSLYSHLKGRIA